MIRGEFVPASEEEHELMMDIFVATREAYTEGVSKARIAQILAWFSATSIDPKSLDAEVIELGDEESALKDRLEETLEGAEPNTDGRLEFCPEEECDSRISGVQTQIGGQIYIEPCGHVVEWDDKEELGAWADEIDPNTP
jgi:hypothetical protein